MLLTSNRILLFIQWRSLCLFCKSPLWTLRGCPFRSFGCPFWWSPGLSVSMKLIITAQVACHIICLLVIFHGTKTYIKIQLNQLHAVSRTQQYRPREPSVKTLLSKLSAEFIAALRVECRTQRLAFALVPRRRNENINK